MVPVISVNEVCHFSAETSSLTCYFNSAHRSCDLFLLFVKFMLNNNFYGIKKLFVHIQILALNEVK